MVESPGRLFMLLYSHQGAGEIGGQAPLLAQDHVGTTRRDCDEHQPPARAVLALGPWPRPDPPRPALLLSPRSSPDANPVLRRVLPGCRAHSGEAVPSPLVPGDRRAAAVVSLSVCRDAVRPRHSGRPILPAAPGAAARARELGRAGAQLAGRPARPARRADDARLCPPPRTVPSSGPGCRGGLHVRGTLDAPSAGRRALHHDRPCLAAACPALPGPSHPRWRLAMGDDGGACVRPAGPLYAAAVDI